MSTKSEVGLEKVVREFLPEQGLQFVENEPGDFSGTMTGENGIWMIRIVAEGRVLKVGSVHPLRVPAGRIEAVGRLLHRLNACLRLGAYVLAEDKRLVAFDVSLPWVTDDEETAKQSLAAALAAVCHVVDEAFGRLAGFFHMDMTPEQGMRWLVSQEGEAGPGQEEARVKLN